MPTPSKSGYAFNGWFTSETGGEKVTTSKKYSANTTIYAQWTQSAFTITLNPSGGAVTPTTVSIGESGRVVSLPNPTKAGYTFDGWYTAASGGDMVAEGYVLSADITVYARWTYNAVTSITDIPKAINVGEQFTLTGKVVPENAAQKTIVWSVEDAGGTGTGVYDGVFLARSEGTVVIKATIANGKGEGVPYEQFFIINAVAVSVASNDRVIPAVSPVGESAVVVPVSALSVGFAAGPNPIFRSFGAVGFFRIGAVIKSADLSVYDASGNVVRRLSVKDVIVFL